MNSPRTFNRPFVVSLALTLLVALATAWAWSRIPAGAGIPTHWNAAGRVNRYGHRTSLLAMPIVLLVMTLLFRLLPRIEPRQEHLLMSSRAYRTVWLLVAAFLSGLQGLMIAAALGHRVSMEKWLGLGVGIVFVVAGNALGKIRSNFFFGVRTPWTLSSELSWNRTHRLTGWMMVVFGLLEMGATLAGLYARWVGYSIGVFTVLLVATAYIYSYRVWSADPNKSARGRPG